MRGKVKEKTSAKLYGSSWETWPSRVFLPTKLLVPEEDRSLPQTVIEVMVHCFSVCSTRA